MKNEITLDNTIKHLKQHYWGNIAFLALIFLAVLFKVAPFLSETQPLNITLERYTIVVTIIAIPAALKLFANKIKKVDASASFDTKINKYKSASFLRLYIISGVTLMNIVLFAVSRNTNFLWFVVVLFIVYLFCKPSYPELNSMILGDDVTTKKQEDGEVT